MTTENGVDLTRQPRLIVEPAQGLTIADRRRIQEALDQAASASTRRVYGSAWRGFEAWCDGRGAPCLPTSAELVAAYLTELAEAELTVATIRLHRAALGAVHRAAGLEDPTASPGVKRVMAGIARARGRAQRQTLNRAGPGRGEGHRQNTQESPQLGPEGVQDQGGEAGQGGRGPSGSAPGRFAAPVRGG